MVMDMLIMLIVMTISQGFICVYIYNIILFNKTAAEVHTIFNLTILNEKYLNMKVIRV